MTSPHLISYQILVVFPFHFYPLFPISSAARQKQIQILFILGITTAASYVAYLTPISPSLITPMLDLSLSYSAFLVSLIKIFGRFQFNIITKPTAPLWLLKSSFYNLPKPPIQPIRLPSSLISFLQTTPQSFRQDVLHLSFVSIQTTNPKLSGLSYWGTSDMVK